MTKECGGRCAEGQRQTLVCKTVNGVAKWVNQCARDTSCDVAAPPTTTPPATTPPISAPSGQCNGANPNNNKNCQSVGQNVDYGSGQCECQLTPGTDACACVNVSGTVQAGGRCYKSSECASGDCSGNVCVAPTTAPAQVPPETAPTTIPCGNSFCSAAQKCVLEEVGIPVCLDSSVVAKNEEINKVVTKVTTLPKQTKDVTKTLNALRGDTRFASPTYSTLSNINPGGSCPESAVDGTACSTQPGYTCKTVSRGDIETRKICLNETTSVRYDYCSAELAQSPNNECGDGSRCGIYDKDSIIYFCGAAQPTSTDGEYVDLATVVSNGYCGGGQLSLAQTCGQEAGVTNGVCDYRYVEARGLYALVCVPNDVSPMQIDSGQLCYNEGEYCDRGNGICTRLYQSKVVRSSYLRCISSANDPEARTDERGLALIGEICNADGTHDPLGQCGQRVGSGYSTGICLEVQDEDGDLVLGKDDVPVKICQAVGAIANSLSVSSANLGELCGINQYDAQGFENHRCARGAAFCLPDPEQPDLIKCQ